MKGAKAGLRANRAADLHRFQEAASVAVGAEVMGVNQRGVAGIAAGQRQRQRPGRLGLGDGGQQDDRPAGRAERPVHQVGRGDVQVQLVADRLA